MLNNNTTYNGWFNYATWRVKLEMFDGMTLDDVGFTPDGEDRDDDEVDLATHLKEMAIERIESESSGLARDYALTFIGYVNFREIAEHMLEDFCETNDRFYSED